MRKTILASSVLLPLMALNLSYADIEDKAQQGLGQQDLQPASISQDISSQSVDMQQADQSSQFAAQQQAPEPEPKEPPAVSQDQQQNLQDMAQSPVQQPDIMDKEPPKGKDEKQFGIYFGTSPYYYPYYNPYYTPYYYPYHRPYWGWGSRWWRGHHHRRGHRW